MSLQRRPCVGQEPQVVRFEGELDAADLGVAETLGAALDSGADCLVVDLLNVTFIDSSVIRALVLAHREVTARGGWLRVVYTHHVVRRVIDMCGLSDVFPQYLTTDAARRQQASAPPSSETTDGRGQPR